MTPLRCRALKHHFRFSTDGPVMRWHCTRCPEAGEKRYGSAGDAARYARAFDLEPWHEQARRAPLLGMFPVRLARVIRQALVKRRARRAGTQTAPP